METRKIAAACFIGGALTMAVALALTPEYWWFGFIAGIAGGYISYEFREVLAAIPIALRAVRAWQPPSRQYWTVVGWGALFFLSFTVWVVGLSAVLVAYGYPDQLTRLYYVGPAVIAGGVGLFTFFSAVCFVATTTEGRALQVETLREMNYYISPPLVLFWHLPRGIRRLPRAMMIGARGVVTFSRFLGRFAWHLFKLIHSEKRVLCAIDGALGGAMAYIWLVPPSATIAEQVLLVICGGLLGSAFGVVNHEIVSKRILHLPEVATAQT